MAAQHNTESEPPFGWRSGPQRKSERRPQGLAASRLAHAHAAYVRPVRPSPGVLAEKVTFAPLDGTAADSTVEMLTEGLTGWTPGGRTPVGLFGGLATWPALSVFNALQTENTQAGEGD